MDHRWGTPPRVEDRLSALRTLPLDHSAAPDESPRKRHTQNEVALAHGNGCAGRPARDAGGRSIDGGSALASRAMNCRSVLSEGHVHATS